MNVITKNRHHFLFQSIYPRLMKLGKLSGCHQRPDRSFFANGLQFPVCARCTGVLIGYLVTVPAVIMFDVKICHCVVFALIMLTDWLIQRIGVAESTNIRRLVSGIFGGVGIFAAEILIIEIIVEKLIEISFWR